MTSEYSISQGRRVVGVSFRKWKREEYDVLASSRRKNVKYTMYAGVLRSGGRAVTA